MTNSQRISTIAALFPTIGYEDPHEGARPVDLRSGRREPTLSELVERTKLCILEAAVRSTGSRELENLESINF